MAGFVHVLPKIGLNQPSIFRVLIIILLIQLFLTISDKWTTFISSEEQYSCMEFR